MKKFLHWAFGKNSWWKKLFGWVWYYRKEFSILICLDSQKIARTMCVNLGRAKLKRFKEGDEPRKRCDFHKLISIPPTEPPPKPKPPSVWKPKRPELKTRLKYLEIDFLGWFVDDFLPTAWDDLEQARKNMYAVLKRMTDELEGDYPAAWSGFLVLSSGQKGHAHCNQKLPWKIQDGKMDWFTFNPKWWIIYDAFVDMLRLFRIEPKPQAFMSGKYNRWLYKNNINGLTDPWNGKVITAQSHFIKELLLRSKWIKFINEPRLRAVFPGDHRATLHGGDHVIADWHRDLFCMVNGFLDLRHLPEYLLQDLRDLIVDVSMRECAFAQLIEFSKSQRACPKCGIKWDNPPGSNRLLRHEKHEVTCLESLEGGERNWFSLSGFVRSAWHAVKASEDGGFYPEAKGYRLFDYPVSFGNADQVEAMLDQAWRTCKNASRKKEFYWGIWPAEVFVQVPGGIRQIYKPDVINWERFKRARDVHRRIY